MDLLLIQYIGSIGGIGGVFGIIMFTIYRQTMGQIREDRKFMEDRLSKVIDAYNLTSSDNTRVLTELIVWLKAKNGSK